MDESRNKVGSVSLQSTTGDILLVQGNILLEYFIDDPESEKLAFATALVGCTRNRGRRLNLFWSK